jgi:hypothetical protein
LGDAAGHLGVATVPSPDHDAPVVAVFAVIALVCGSILVRVLKRTPDV